MSARDRYPAGVPCWVDTTQPDVDAATAFYSELFGWEPTGPGEMPGDPPGRYYVARAGGGEVAGIASCPPGQSGAAWNTYVAVDDAEAAVERATAAGATVLAAPFDAAPAGRAAVLTDPVGATICLWQPAARQGAERVNEPGAWTMSMLVLRRPGACRGVLRRGLRLDDRAVRAGHDAAAARLRGRRTRAAGVARGRRGPRTAGRGPRALVGELLGRRRRRVRRHARRSWAARRSRRPTSRCAPSTCAIRRARHSRSRPRRPRRPRASAAEPLRVGEARPGTYRPVARRPGDGRRGVAPSLRRGMRKVRVGLTTG